MLFGLLKERNLEFIVYPFYLFFRYPDKTAHVILYLNLGVLINLTLRASNNIVLKKHPGVVSLAIGSIYGVTDEIHQLFIPYRSPDIMDFMADFTGLLIAQLLILSYYSLRKSRLGLLKV
jgi:VanZ family protein